MTRVLVAPDCFGGSLTAVEAAEAIAVGWQRSRPGDEVALAPQSDGGPGFVDVLATQLGRRHRTRVAGPLGAEVEAEWVFDAGTGTAYLECAQACGLPLLGGRPTVATALAAHSAGVGQLIVAALESGARTIAVGLGGSASTDGGRGVVEVLGGLPAGRGRLAGVDLIAASDVEHPLLGPLGAARVFGPQKGADEATVMLLEQRLTAWGAELDAFAAGFGAPAVSIRAGAGAAGGIGAALFALGGRRESGAAIVAAHTRLAERIAATELVVTGEGRLDAQSLHGKVVSALADGARRAGVPVVVLAGQVALDAATLLSAGVRAAHSVADHAGSVRLAIDDAAAQLTGLVSRNALDFEDGTPSGKVD